MKTKSDREKLDTAATGAFAGEEAAERIDSKKGFKDVMEHIMKAIFLVCGLVAIAFVLVISIYLIVSGIPAIREVGLWNFLAGSTWDPANNTTGALFGILPMILTSIYGTCGAIIIGVPIGSMRKDTTSGPDTFLRRRPERQASRFIPAPKSAGDFSLTTEPV